MKTISDMYLVATFLALNVSPRDIQEQGTRKQFVFDSVAHDVVVLEDGDIVRREEMELDEVESAHVSGNLLISSDRLCSAIKNVKAMIHART